VVIIIKETSESILDFVLAYFVNLVTFNSKRYTTFTYIILRGFFTKTSKSVTARSLQRSKHSVQLNLNVIENTKLRKLKGEGNLDL
jgi:hypothetical protein